jgi:hypothetical protein
MKLPKRFTLTALFLLVTAMAVIFGYAQWRRQRLIAEVKSLVSEIDSARPLQVYDNWFWPTVPEQVVVMIRKDGDQFVAKEQKLSLAEAMEYLESKGDRLRAIGVRKVSYGVVIRRPQGSVTVFMRDSIDELTLEE